MLQAFLSLAFLLATWVQPATVDVTGNAAGRAGGALNGYAYWLGTNLDMPGTADLRWAARCRELQVDMQPYGPLATKAQVTFYKGGKVVEAQTVPIAPVTLASKTFDRVVLVNASPDPAAIDDSATITLNGVWCR